MIAQKQASAQDLLAPLDPFSCEYEPIHSPGAIQPHGALLELSAQTLLITHASANLIDILGRSAESALGRPLAEVIGTTACKVLLTVQTDAGRVSDPVHTLAIVNGSAVCMRAYGSGSHICVDIEAAQTMPQESTSANVAQPILQTFQHATSPAALCELAVLGLRQISGYDRVMAYRFHEDGHGEVIAEARAAQLEPYLGLHYPAADVPPQARKLYLSQRVGAIADSRYVPVPILIDPAIDNDAPLDLTHSCLRSVSPIHCEYMRNMKTAASMTIALANGADLWGMLVCHHQTPRIAPVEVRALAILIGQVASLLLRSLGEAELYAKRHQRHVMLRAFVERLAKPMLLEHALEAGEAELLAVTDSAGALVKISGKTFTFGHNPPPDVAARALATLSSRQKAKFWQ